MSSITKTVAEMTPAELEAFVRAVVRDEMKPSHLPSYRIGEASEANWQRVLDSFIALPIDELSPVKMLLQEREQWRNPSS